MKSNGVQVHWFGPVTDNDVGVEFVRNTLGIEAINASQAGEGGVFVETC